MTRVRPALRVRVAELLLGTLARGLAAPRLGELRGQLELAQGLAIPGPLAPGWPALARLQGPELAQGRVSLDSVPVLELRFAAPAIRCGRMRRPREPSRRPWGGGRRSAAALF